MPDARKRAIISVSNKDGVVDFAKGLVDLGFKIVSTGGTRRTLEEAGIDVGAISDLTGFPEILGGRVKTLHPAIYAGILARRCVPEDMAIVAKMDLPLFQVVAVNLYPFQETIAKKGVTLEEAIEQIDIGGPSMLRATAKSHPDVVPVVDPADYGKVLKALRDGGPSPKERRRLAAKVFAHTSRYDAAITEYLQSVD
jgi:phosphoribosylaminoimidazolecarboxamide formyltransferase/IMP cyclohydrolase